MREIFFRRRKKFTLSQMTIALLCVVNSGSCISRDPICENRRGGSSGVGDCRRDPQDNSELPSVSKKVDMTSPESDKSLTKDQQEGKRQEWDCELSKFGGVQRWTCKGNTDLAYRCSPEGIWEKMDCRSQGKLCRPPQNPGEDASCSID